MRRREGRRAQAPLVALAALVCAAVCCGNRRDTAAVVGDGIDGSDAAPPFGTNDDAGACRGAVHCSADLHSILDCNDATVRTCPDAEGCAAGSCVSACDAARANQSTIGCDYYAVPVTSSVGAGGCYAAFIANTWSVPVTLSVDIDGQPLSVAGMARVPSGAGHSLSYAPLPGGQLPPGQIAILFLDQFGVPPDKLLTPACPDGVVAGVTTRDPALHATGIGSAFHIATSAPVVAYDIFPYGGGKSAVTSASLLLPTTAWDVNYVAVDAYSYTHLDDEGSPFISIVAAEADTQVTVLPRAAIVGGPGVVGVPAGQPSTFTLGKGQVLSISQHDELTGSPIQATKPIGVIGGNGCMNVPLGTSACDTAHQQIPPVKALGHEYAAVRYRNRFDGQGESPPWRVVGVVAGTALTYDPAPPSGAPATLDLGETVLFAADEPFVVRSQDEQHPFYLGGYMTGCAATGSARDCRGDPEFVNTIPPAEYLRSYVFFTDPTYPETNLVLVRVKGPSGFSDVELDCAPTLSGWKPVGASSAYEYTRIDLSRHDFEGQNGCDNGRHEIHSAGPFGLTVWGWGSAETGGDPFDATVPGIFSQFVSYAYPAGASVHPINTVVVPPTK